MQIRNNLGRFIKNTIDKKIRCLNCNNIFITNGNKKFCSRRCSNVFNGYIIKNKEKIRKIVKCSNCGKEKKIRHTEFKKSKNKIFYCSKKCLYIHAKVRPSKLKGRKLSDKTKNKLRLANLGKHLSEETKKKLRVKRVFRDDNLCKECGKIIGYNKQYCLNHKHLLWKKEQLENLHKITSKKLTGKMPKNIMTPGKYGNIKRGYFDINGKKLFFRSKWEANYALYLDFLIKNKQIKEWKYEEDVFIFEKIKFGTRSYRPDFKIFKNNKLIEYHEVKGQMTAKSKTQLNRMRIYYPNIKLVLIDREYYNDIKRKIGKMLKFY